jgi:Zn finger protein HypA/HybF involved in hydrogenase expression
MEFGTGQRLRCVECGSDDYNMITGGELLIKDMEVV